MVLQTGESGNKLTLDGVIDIASAAELKRLLLEARGTGRPTSIRLAEAVDLDVTAVQLLCAATRQGDESGSRATVAGDIPASVATLLAEAALHGVFKSETSGG